MPAWSDLFNQFEAFPDDAAKTAWMRRESGGALNAIAARRNSNVLFYGSAFLQKGQLPAPLLSITFEDLNGFMASIYGMDWGKPLSLILHTPGGSPNAAETIVGYLRSKFAKIEVIVPTIAFSAGTMIALSADRIVMGRQSQLGPIDPQFVSGAISVSAQAVVDQFELAKAEISSNRDLAHAWAPILASIGPALLQEAKNALGYGENMVATWLEKYMFTGQADAKAKAAAVAKHFNDAQTHRSHGRRIDRVDAAAQGLIVEELEADQQLQEDVLTLYHLITIAFEKGPLAKVIYASNGTAWAKNHM